MKQSFVWKTLLSLTLLVVASVSFAGPPAVPAPTPNVDIQSFADEVAKAGNFSLAVSPGYAPKLGAGEWGLAVLGGYQATPYVGAFIRADLFDKNYTVASGSATFQYPIKFGKLTFRPFAEAGVGSVLGGAGDKNKDVFAIAGGGAMVDLWHSQNGVYSFSAGGAIETWEPVYHGIAIYRGFGAFTIHF